MALENLGLSLALNWIYDAFGAKEPDHSQAVEFMAERRATRSKTKSRRTEELESPLKEEHIAGEQCSANDSPTVHHN